MSNAQLRETVTLFYLEGKKTTEIAKIQAITQTAVTTRLNRFRGKLRKRLAQEILKRRRPS
jgi:DNA-directed RNA polymerase specialized sigma24 family protein